MSTLRRYLDILDLFNQAKPDWTISEISFSLEIPASTVYRTVRELLAESMLEQSHEAHYRLGAAFIEFDRRVRRADLLIRRSGALLEEIAIQVGQPCAVVLARLYNGTVMCVADAHWNGYPIRTSYERGRPQPLTRGATSKVILAQLPSRRLSRLLGTADGEASSILEFRKELAVVKRCGYAITRGEVDAGLVGIAAPVSCPEHTIAASLSIILPAPSITDMMEDRLVLLATVSANLLVNRLLSDSVDDTDAVGIEVEGSES